MAFLSGDLEMAETRLGFAAEEFEELGDRGGIGWANGLLAYVRFFQRRFADAELLAIKVRADALELGELWAPAMMDSLLASIRLWSGRFSESEELSRRALHAFRELGDRFGMVQALAPRVRSLIALGRTGEAERAIEEAMALGDGYGDFAFPSMVAAGGAVHLGLGERAVVISESALAQLDGDGQRRLRGSSHAGARAVPGRPGRGGAGRAARRPPRHAVRHGRPRDRGGAHG